ncbi:MAG: co-chaperone GroES [Clostridia bacterium]|nr:co-chaperone GroES [Clostridia bacterium]
MKLKPLFDRVIIIEDKEELSSNGIFIGSVNKDNVKTGKVVAIGEGNVTDDGKKNEMFVKVNDRVIYSKFAGIETTIDNKKMFVIRQTDILAIIEE